MFCSSLYTRFSLESVFAWCGPHRDWSHGEGPDSGPLVSVQGLRGQSGGQGTVQHRNQQVGGHGCQQLLILMLSAHHFKIQFFTLKLGQQQAYYVPSHYGLLPPIIVYSVTDPPPTVLSMSCCGWNHNTVGFLSQVVNGRPLLSPLALIRPLAAHFRRLAAVGGRRLFPSSSSEDYLLLTWQNMPFLFQVKRRWCRLSPATAMSHFKINHFYLAECWGWFFRDIQLLKPLPQCWISWKLQKTGGWEQQKVEKISM